MLTPARINENGGVGTVTAMIEHPARGPVAFQVQIGLLPAGRGAGRADYRLSRNRLLTIARGSTSSTGTVTITAVDDDDYGPPEARKILHVRGYRHEGVTSALVTPWQELEIVDDEGTARAEPGR